MNALQKVIARLFGIKEAPSSRTLTTRDQELARLFGMPTHAGKTVTDTAALQVSTAWACVRVLAETIGNLPLQMYERTAEGGATKVSEHPLGQLLGVMPNADMTSVEYREAKVTNLALRGNAYSYIERSGKVIASLYPLMSEFVTPKRDPESGVVYYEFQDGGKIEKLPREKVWHIKGFGANGLMGFSPIAYARQSLGMSLAAEEFQARFFANGANPSWLISIPQWLDDEQRAIAQKNVKEIWQGLDNAHRAAILEGGMTATAATMPLDDAQFMQLRGFSIQEICRIYRIPPHMVMDLSRSTNNNIEHQGQEFVTFTLAPYLTRIEASAVRWLLPPEDRRRFFLRFNVDALLRADSAGRAALYSSAVQNGWMSRNEVRALENRNEVEGLEGYTAQTNLAPVDKIMEGPPEPKPAPVPPPPQQGVVVAQPPEEQTPPKFWRDSQQPPVMIFTGTGRNDGREGKRVIVEVAGMHELADAIKAGRDPTAQATPALLLALKTAFDMMVSAATLARDGNADALKEVGASFAKAIAQQGIEQTTQLKAIAHALGPIINQAREEQAKALSGVMSGIDTLITLGQSERELVLDDDGNPIRTRVALQ